MDILKQIATNPTTLLMVGTVLAMCANIVTGICNARANGKSFDKEKFESGLWRACGVFLSLILLYVAGWLNQSVVVIDNGNGTGLTILDAIQTMVLGAFIAYSAKALRNTAKAMMRHASDKISEKHNKSVEKISEKG